MSRCSSRSRPWSFVFVAGLLAMSLVAGACSHDETADRIRRQTAERAADPAHALSTTLPGQPTTTVLDDPEVSFHTGPEVGDAPFDRLRRAVILARMDLRLDGPVDVYVFHDPDDYLDEYLGGLGASWDRAEAAALLSMNSLGGWVDGRGAIFLNGRTVFERYPSGKNLFVTTAHETAHVAQEARIRQSGPAGSEVAGGAWLVWLVEGHAELVAWQLADAHGELERPWADQRQLTVQLALDHDQPLDAYDADPFPQHDVDGRYSLWYLAVELLATRVGRDVLDVELWERVGTQGWETAFAEVFGQSIAEFHEEFAAWRAEGFPAP